MFCLSNCFVEERLDDFIDIFRSHKYKYNYFFSNVGTVNKCKIKLLYFEDI